jgi:hypothetical protein
VNPDHQRPVPGNVHISFGQDQHAGWGVAAADPMRATHHFWTTVGRSVGAGHRPAG